MIPAPRAIFQGFVPLVPHFPDLSPSLFCRPSSLTCVSPAGTTQALCQPRGLADMRPAPPI